MKLTIPSIFLSLAVFSATAHAAWFTQVDDDVFTGGKSAMFVGSFSNSDVGLAFDCTSEALSMSYVMQWKTPQELSGIETKLVVKVDGNQPQTFSGAFDIRNDSAVAITVEDREAVLKVLKQIQAAKSKILIGYAIPSTGFKVSFSGNALNSTSAANSFIKACNIQL